MNNLSQNVIFSNFLSYADNLKLSTKIKNKNDLPSKGYYNSKINGKLLVRINKIKNLGIIFQSTDKFHKHCEYIPV